MYLDQNNTIVLQKDEENCLPITWAQESYIDDQYDRVSFEIYQEQLRARQTHGFTRDLSLLDRLDLKNSYADFVMGLASWKSFITLTFKDPVGPDVAYAKYRSLVALLNRRLFGKHYSQKVGHSYFSYCLGMEFQRRDVIHFHVIVDKPIDFQLIHTWWNAVAGFAWITPVEDITAVVSYVTKYMVKDGELLLYKKTTDRAPIPRPIWWT